MKTWVNKLLIMLLCVVSACFFVLTIRGGVGNEIAPKIGDSMSLAGGPFESSHERAPFVSMLSLVRNRSVVLTQDLADFGSPDIGFIKEKFYSFFPIGVSLLILPLYVIGAKYNLGVLGAVATMPLIAMATLVIIFLIARNILRLPAWASVFASLVFAFASPSWSYAITLYQHQVSVFLMLSSVYCVWLYSKRGPAAWVWSALFGFFYGFSVFVDYPNAILLFPVAIYFALESLDFTRSGSAYSIKLRASAIVMFAILAIITIAHLTYNQVELGSWRRFHNTLPRYTTETYANTFNESEAEAKKKENISQVFREANLIKGSYELFVAPDKGVFFFSPILLFALLGIYFALKRSSPVIVTLLALAALNFLLYASFGDPWGGWAYGPRYVVPAMGILSLFAALGLAESGRAVLTRLIAFILSCYSAAVALLGVVTTNLLPPKVEADYFHLKYTYLRNLDFLRTGVTDNFIYKTYFANRYHLTEYYLTLLFLLLVVFFLVLFILPLYKEDSNV